MTDRFLLDTNIFVDSFDASAPEKRRKARALIREALTSHKGVVSYPVVQEFFNVALRLQGSGGLSWYDALIVAGAAQAECGVLLSEDLQDGRRFGGMKVENPFG